MRLSKQDFDALLKAASLDPKKKYVLFCQHEERSSAAA